MKLGYAEFRLSQIPQHIMLWDFRYEMTNREASSKLLTRLQVETLVANLFATPTPVMDTVTRAQL